MNQKISISTYFVSVIVFFPPLSLTISSYFCLLLFLRLLKIILFFSINNISNKQEQIESLNTELSEVEFEK
jgi:hypothetical protein